MDLKNKLILLALVTCPSFLSGNITLPKKKEQIVLYFPFDKAILNNEYLTNAASLKKLDSLLRNHETLSDLNTLSVSAYSSPEGNPAYNNQLALARANEIKTFILTKYPEITASIIDLKSDGENWEGLRIMVEQDNSVPAQQEILEILSQDRPSIEKEAAIKGLNQGRSWNYIYRKFFPYLRGSSCIMLLSNSDLQKPAIQPTGIIQETVAEEVVLIPETTTTPIYTTQDTSLDEYRIVRPLALKTNLLFDAATLLNVELEVPIANRFSIAGEWIFPWWLWKKKQNCLEVLSGNLEARYWFKPNYSKQNERLNLHNPLTGWFVGLYGGGGLYDLERKREGYQGEFFIATGISGGYVLPLTRNLNMEFSLGLGVLRTKYRHYHAEYCDIHNDWHLEKQSSGRHTWIGPTKAKISFIWYPHFNMKKKGGSR